MAYTFIIIIWTFFQTAECGSSLSKTSNFKRNTLEQLYFARLLNIQENSGKKCNSTVWCYNGSCNSTYQCECIQGYTTFTPDDSDNDLIEYGPTLYCNYEKKRVFVAFMLELFLPFGSGQFYLMNYDFAFFKLFFFIMTMGSIYIFVKAKRNKDTPDTTILIYSLNLYMFLPILVFWQIADIIILGLNNYKDGNNVEVDGW